jgi:RimJ/RimL family protein N-acetyltransferase
MNKENEPSFETDRLKVFNWRKYNSDSIQLLKAIQSITTPKVMKSLPPSWQVLDTTKARIEWIKAREAESYCLAICKKESEDMVGLLLLSMENTDTRVGYLIAEKSWGKGFASEAISGLCKYVSENGFAKTITGGVDPTNIASVKVLTNNGFVKDSFESNSSTHFYRYTCHTE